MSKLPGCACEKLLAEHIMRGCIGTSFLVGAGARLPPTLWQVSKSASSGKAGGTELRGFVKARWLVASQVERLRVSGAGRLVKVP
mmetsp:Transcript_45018/g.80865  ORF Transcript_45018/g.80865 Transcript_45018/m.80865 type:complete len:85 (-) Transcript_45018:805-1059(-)